jgi:cell division protein FtsI (penicillin-binding protein 3)
VSLVAEPRRWYPLRDLAGPVLGFANIDGKGIEGVELALDEKLHGERATLPVIRDRKGELVVASDLDPRGDGAGNAAVPGATVQLTIDRTIQFAAERALIEGVKENKARAGIVVVMDPRNGEVLAMASTPGYDPNQAEEKDPAARDRPIVDAYEPGSVMKVFSVSAALENHAIKPSDEIDLQGGRLQIGKYTISDTHPHGVVPVGEVIKFSSNVGAAKIASRLGAEKLVAQYRKFGFFTRTGIELPGESPGRVRNPAHWGDTGLATASYGYGLQVSPIQLTAGLVAVANGGTWFKPSIVKRIVGGDGKLLYEHVPESHRALSPETSAAMTAMMKTVVEKGGTAESLHVHGFVIAGKTGTAYKHDPVTKHYAKDRYLASFA